MLREAKSNATWTKFFYVKHTPVTDYYQYIDTDDTALPRNLVQPPKDLPVSFAGCKRLVDIGVLRKWDMSGVTSTRCMFRNCNSLHDLSPIAKWDMSGVRDMSYMFQNCTDLSDLGDFMEWKLSSSVKMDFIFAGCTSMSERVTEMLQSFSRWRIYMAVLYKKPIALEVHTGETEYYNLLMREEFPPM